MEILYHSNDLNGIVYLEFVWQLISTHLKVGYYSREIVIYMLMRTLKDRYLCLLSGKKLKEENNQGQVV